MQINHISSVMRTGSIKMPEKIKSGEIDLTHAVSGKGSSLPDSYIQQIREQAKKDFAEGVYMTKDYCNMQKSYLAKNVSPNRAAAISQVSSFMNTITRASTQGSILDLFGMPYTANVHKGLTRTTAAIYNEYGEMIAGYHSDNGYWQSVPTKAEEQCWMEADQAYLAAWQELRQEQQGALAAEGGTGSSFNTLA